jgi:hypothetical protein
MTDRMPCKLSGAIGSFGAGMGLQVAYVQTTFGLDGLEQVTLAEELPGSDEWPIRDLFQRDINHHRVKTQILPWLRDGRRIKFLPPIVLAVIPRTADTGRVISEVPERDIGVVNSPVVVTRATGKFSFEKSEPGSNLGFLEWDPAACWLVALDGQHRIASLRRWWMDSANDAPADWTVPAIVVAATRQVAMSGRAPTQLDFARSVFVYVNTQARIPSANRRILLDDADPHAMIVQELIERAQARGPSDRSLDVPSIALFSWRDDDARFMGDCHRPYDVEELYGCVTELLLPASQCSSAAIKHLLGSNDDHVTRWVGERYVPLEFSAEFRRLALASIVPVLEKILTHCAPLRAYLEHMNVELRRLSEAGNGSEGGVRLFACGGSRTGIGQAALSSAGDAALRLQASRSCMPVHFREAIGLRAVMSGFRIVCGFLRGTPNPRTTLAQLERYIRALNNQFEAGWLVNDVNESPGKFLRHITRSPDGRVKNYRFEDIEAAGGAFCALLASKELFGVVTRDLQDAVKQLARKTLYETVRQGYVSELKAEIKRQHPSYSAGQVKDEAQRDAPRRAHRRIDAILHELDLAT